MIKLIKTVVHYVRLNRRHPHYVVKKMWHKGQKRTRNEAFYSLIMRMKTEDAELFRLKKVV